MLPAVRAVWSHLSLSNEGQTFDRDGEGTEVRECNTVQCCRSRGTWGYPVGSKPGHAGQTPILSKEIASNHMWILTLNFKLIKIKLN